MIQDNNIQNENYTEPKENGNVSTDKDPKPPANTWPKIVAAVASALCTVAMTLYFTMKKQYETERKDRLELILTNKDDKIAYEKNLIFKQNEIDSCGIKTISKLREQLQEVKDLNITVTSNVNEVVTDNKVTYNNIKNLKAETKKLKQKISKNE